MLIIDVLLTLINTNVVIIIEDIRIRLSTYTYKNIGRYNHVLCY